MRHSHHFAAPYTFTGHSGQTATELAWRSTFRVPRVGLPPPGARGYPRGGSPMAMTTSRGLMRSRWAMTRDAFEELRATAARLANEAAQGDGFVTGYMVGDADAPSLVPNLGGHRLIHQLESVRAVLAAAAVETEAGVAVIGRAVTLEDADGARLTYTLVAPGHGDPARGLLSADSPVGRAISGSRAGETIQVDAPNGTWTAVVVGVEDEDRSVSEWDSRLS
jgi:hypothetical protein